LPLFNDFLFEQIKTALSFIQKKLLKLREKTTLAVNIKLSLKKAFNLDAYNIGAKNSSFFLQCKPLLREQFFLTTKGSFQ
jgi:hypothetical protein